MPLKYWYYFILSMFEDLWEWIAEHLPFREYMCGVVGHRYYGAQLSKNDDGEGAMVADTERGCIYCNYSEKNIYQHQIDERPSL